MAFFIKAVELVIIFVFGYASRMIWMSSVANVFIISTYLIVLFIDIKKFILERE